jgi:hypothetical protein
MPFSEILITISCSFFFFNLAFVLGYFVLNKIYVRQGNFLFNVGYSILIGYGILSYLTLFLSILGQIDKLIIFIFSLIVFVLGRKSSFYFYENLKIIIGDIKKQSSLNNILLGILFFLIIAASFSAFMPPYRGDAIASHLPAAKIIAEGGIFGEKWNRLISPNFIGFPMLIETLYALVVIIHDFTLAHLIHYQIFLAMLLVIYVFLRERFSKIYGLMGCILIFGIFELVVNATVAYVDAAMVSFDIAGFLIFIDWFFSNKKRSLVLSALLLGLGASVKYLSLFNLIIIGLFFLFKVVFIDGKKVGEIFKTGSVFLFVFLIAGGFWYFKNLIFYNNPFYPFVLNLFSSNTSSYFNAEIEMVKFSFSPLYPRSLWGFLTMPFRVFNEPHYYPVLFGFIIMPFMFFIRKIDMIRKNKKIILFLFLYILIFFALWYFSGIQIRRYSMDGQVVLMILAAIIIASVLIKMTERIKLVWIVILAVLVSAPLFFAAAFYEDSYLLKYGKLQIRYILGLDSKYDFYSFQNAGEEFFISEYINKNLINENIINDLCIDEGNFLLDNGNRFVRFSKDSKLEWAELSKYLKENNISYLFSGVEGKEKKYHWKTGACSIDWNDYKDNILPLEELVKEHSNVVYDDLQIGVQLYKIKLD